MVAPSKDLSISRLDELLGIGGMEPYRNVFDALRRGLECSPRESYSLLFRQPDDSRVSIVEVRPRHPSAAVICLYFDRMFSSVWGQMTGFGAGKEACFNPRDLALDLGIGNPGEAVAAAAEAVVSGKLTETLWLAGTLVIRSRFRLETPIGPFELTRVNCPNLLRGLLSRRTKRELSYEAYK